MTIDMHVLAVGVLGITIILEIDFLIGDILLNGSWVDLDEILKWSCGRTVVVQGEKHQRSLAIYRSGEKTLDMWANCVLKHCLSLKTFIPYFVAFFLSLVIVISFICKMSFLVTSAKQEFTPVGHCFIIHLPEGGQCPLVRDSEPITLLVIPTSPSLYMLIQIIARSIPLLWLKVITRSNFGSLIQHKHCI